MDCMVGTCQVVNAGTGGTVPVNRCSQSVLNVRDNGCGLRSSIPSRTGAVVGMQPPAARVRPCISVQAHGREGRAAWPAVLPRRRRFFCEPGMEFSTCQRLCLLLTHGTRARAVLRACTVSVDVHVAVVWVVWVASAVVAGDRERMCDTSHPARVAEHRGRRHWRDARQLQGFHKGLPR